MSGPADGPGPDEDDGPPRPLMGPAFWIALGFGLLCVLAGLALAKLGPIRL